MVSPRVSLAAGSPRVVFRHGWAVNNWAPAVQSCRRHLLLCHDSAAPGRAAPSEFTLPDISLDDVFSGLNVSGAAIPAARSEPSAVSGSAVAHDTAPPTNPPGPSQARKRGRRKHGTAEAQEVSSQHVPGDAGLPSRGSALQGSLPVSMRANNPASSQSTSRPGQKGAAVPSQAPIELSPDVTYGLLQTSLRRRSRLFNLGTQLPLQSLAGATQRPGSGAYRAPEQGGSAGSALHPRRGATRLSGAAQVPNSQDGAFVSSTRQRKKTRQPHSAADVAHDAAAQPMLQGGPTVQRRSTPTGSRAGVAAFVPPPPPHLPGWEVPAGPPVQSLRHGHEDDAWGAAAQPPLPRTRTRRVDASPAPLASPRMPSLPPVTMATWADVSARGWPELYTPAYHSSLYEWVLDLLVDTAQHADARRPEPVLRVLALLSACCASHEPLVRHSAVLALCDALADREDLQPVMLQTLPTQVPGLLDSAVFPLLRVLYPHDLHDEGCLAGLVEAMDAAARTAAPSLGDATSAGVAPPAPPPPTAKRRGRPPKSRSASVASADGGSGDAGPGTGGARDSGAGSGEWDQLVVRLQRLKAVHPAVALGPLITTADVSCPAE